MVVFILFGLGIQVARAQGPAVNDRVAHAMPSSYAEPACKLKSDYSKLISGVNALKTAVESTEPEARARALQEGEAVLLQAIQENKDDQNPGAWYYLGRVYLYQGNVVGADSALRRATELAPDCAANIGDYRYVAWAPLINAGIEFSRAKNNDSALVLFRQADVIYPGKPQTTMSLGVVFANTGELDSAVVYFRQAAEQAERDTMPEERNRATFNLAAMLQRLNRHEEAAAALERYVSWKPDDAEAKHGLAVSYRASGQTQKAQALEKDVLSAAGSDTNAAAGAPISVENMMRVGVNFYREKNYAEAAKTFRQVLETETQNRDAIFNLANTYLALKDGASLREIGVRLVAIEPLSETALRLLGNGYRQTNDIDNAVKTAEKLLALPVDVTVQKFIIFSEGVKLNATATGRGAQTASGQSIPPAPVTLNFEFLDTAGNVVATQDAVVPALKPEEAAPIAVDAKGTGIIAWRYARK